MCPAAAKSRSPAAWRAAGHRDSTATATSSVAAGAAAAWTLSGHWATAPSLGSSASRTNRSPGDTVGWRTTTTCCRGGTSTTCVRRSSHAIASSAVSSAVTDVNRSGRHDQREPGRAPTGGVGRDHGRGDLGQRLAARPRRREPDGPRVAGRAGHVDGHLGGQPRDRLLGRDGDPRHARRPGGVGRVQVQQHRPGVLGLRDGPRELRRLEVGDDDQPPRPRRLAVEQGGRGRRPVDQRDRGRLGLKRGTSRPGRPRRPAAPRPARSTGW